MLPDARGIGPGSAPRDLPSTCAGGQDDVSSQANSLKLYSEAGGAEGQGGERPEGSRGCLRMLPELVREVRPGTYLPHAPGVRMT